MKQPEHGFSTVKGGALAGPPAGATPRSRDLQRVAGSGGIALLGLLIAAYSTLFITLSFLRHESLHSNALDLGNMDQAVWSVLHGHFLLTSNLGLSTRLASHFDPFLAVLAPLYLIAPTPKTLLVVQTLTLAAGALPVYLLARRKLQSTWLGLAFASSYLLYPALQGANLFDYHPVTFATLFLLLALDALDRERYVPFCLWSLLAMTTKEDIAALVTLCGLYIWWRTKRSWPGTVVTGAAAVWFVVVVWVIIPHFNNGGVSPYVDRYERFGNSPGAIIAGLGVHPNKVADTLFTRDQGIYILSLLGPLLGLPLLAPALLALMTPTLLINMLSNSQSQHTIGAYHYQAALIPFLYAAAIAGLDRFSQFLSLPRSNRRPHYIFNLGVGTVLLVAACIGQQSQGFTPLRAGFVWPQVTRHAALLSRFLAAIPPAASVAAQSSLNPHVSEREKLHIFTGNEATEDYILLDVTADPYPFDRPLTYFHAVQHVLDTGAYRVVLAQEGYLLLQRQLLSVKGTPLPDSFYSFMLPADPVVAQHVLQVRFGDLLECTGYDVHSGDPVDGQADTVTVTLHWRALRPLSQNYLLPLYLTDSTGQIIDNKPYQPGTLWLPTNQWPVGRDILITTNGFVMRPGEDYGFGMGVVLVPPGTPTNLLYSGGAANPANVIANRIPPQQVQPQGGSVYKHIKSQARLFVFDNGTLLHLGTLHAGNSGGGAYLAGITPDSPVRDFRAPHPEHPLRATFGSNARLLGYSLDFGRHELFHRHLTSGDHLRLTLYWQGQQPTAIAYKVFIHILDETGQNIATADSEPVQGMYPLPAWATGEIVVDTHQLDLPFTAQSPFHLELGLYNGKTGQRLPVTQGAAKSDALRLSLDR